VVQLTGWGNPPFGIACEVLFLPSAWVLEHRAVVTGQVGWVST